VHNSSSREEFDQPRPEYRGTLKLSPVTGRMEIHSSHCARRVRLLVSYAICLVLLAVTIATMAFSFWLEHVFLDLQRRKFFYFTLVNDYATLVPTIVYCVLIPVLNVAYDKIGTLLTQWENHRYVFYPMHACIRPTSVLTKATSSLSLSLSLYFIAEINRHTRRISI
jgi:hypothetical protein